MTGGTSAPSATAITTDHRRRAAAVIITAATTAAVSYRVATAAAASTKSVTRRTGVVAGAEMVRAAAVTALVEATRLGAIPAEQPQRFGLITRRADLERAQLLVQSASRPALQDYLRAWSERLFASAPRAVRWHLDVDPIEFN